MQTSLQRSGVGVQEPRITHLPESFDVDVSKDRADSMVDLAELAGLSFDPWQVFAAEGATRTRQDGKWSAFRVGVSANRQNGKGSILEGRQLAGLFLWGETLQVHTAHEFRTAQKHFHRVLTLIESTPTLDRLVSRVRRADGEEAIETKSGTSLQFMARSLKSGRGITGDTVYLDEAFALKPQMMASLMSTMSARSVQGNPQLWYASSAGMHDSEVWENVRSSAIEGTDPRLAYMEWSAPDGADMDDPEVWRAANPGFGVRISEEFIRSERSAMGDEEFKRERLGIWAPVGGERLFPAELWQSGATDRPLERGLPVAFALDVPPSRDVATLCAAARLPDGRVRFEIVDRFDNFHVIADRLKALQEKWNPVAVVVDSMAAAGTMIDDLRRDGVRTRQLSGREYTEACARFFDLVTERSVVHGDQPELNEAVDAAEMKRRSNSSVWVWARKDITHDISPLVGCTLALHGLSKAKTEKKKRQVTFL